MKLTLNVNGKPAPLDVDDPGMALLYALRDNLGLRGPRFGCGLAQCGARTVLLNGQAMRSCVYPVGSVGSASVVTLEGLGNSAHPLQQAFIDEQAVQCGYCINGMIMQAGCRPPTVSYTPSRADEVFHTAPCCTVKASSGRCRSRRRRSLLR